MSLDTQTTLQLAVSHRLEKALKVDHLTTNPLKAERGDFIPPLVLKRIEDVTKRNLDLSWALDNAAGKQPFSGRHPANSSQGGKNDYARQRGRGGGASRGRGNDWRPHPTPPKRKIMNSGPGPIFFPGTIPDIFYLVF
jgi:hypothetical protein